MVCIYRQRAIPPRDPLFFFLFIHTIQTLFLNCEIKLCWQLIPDFLNRDQSIFYVKLAYFILLLIVQLVKVMDNHAFLFGLYKFLNLYLFQLLQIPFCVVIGWIMGRPMDLNFQLFETATLFITVLVVAFLLQVCVPITEIREKGT